MSLKWIREQYNVPAKRGGRVRYTGSSQEQFGTILRATGHLLRIQMDGQTFAGLYHPTWELEYLPARSETSSDTNARGSDA